MDMTKVSLAFGKVGYTLKKYAPEILTSVGVIGMVTATVFACKETLKATEIIENAKGQLENIKEVSEEYSEEDYSADDKKKDTVIVYTHTALELAKVYAPAIVIGGLSIVGIFSGNNILRKRNVALAAAYATLDKSFKDYRKRVVEKLGDDADKEFKYNLKAEKASGKNKKKDPKDDVIYVDPDDPNYLSEYSVIFDETNPYYQKDASYNKSFLKAQQAYANNILHTRGYLYLNEVYKMLGFEPTKAGQVVGWLYDKNDEYSDNYVDFGVFDVNRKKVREFMNGFEPSIILDFNVTGNIWEKM